MANILFYGWGCFLRDAAGALGGARECVTAGVRAAVGSPAGAATVPVRRMICPICHGLITGRLNKKRRYCNGTCLERAKAAGKETRRIEQQLAVRRKPRTLEGLCP